MVFLRAESARRNPNEQWIAIPARDTGLQRETVNAARKMVQVKRRTTNKGRRSFEFGGKLYCGGCGK